MSGQRIEWAGAPVWARFAGYPQAWEHALREYDLGRPEKLGELVASGFQMTPEARAAVADIVAGKRKPDLRGKHRAKLPDALKAQAIRHLERLREVRRIYREDADIIADKRGKEPSQVLAWIERQYRIGLAHIAAKFGVSPRTVENWGKPGDALKK
jgi:hypothetical protein